MMYGDQMMYGDHERWHSKRPTFGRRYGVLLGAVLLFADGMAAAAQGEAGWISLFDGKTLNGWTQVNGTASYEVVDGAIVGTTRLGSPNSFLATNATYRDFVLEVEVKQEGGPSNSGIQFRSAVDPEYNGGRVFGYQVEIDPSARDWTGGIYDEHRRGWLYPTTLNPAARGLYKLGEWNRLRVEAIGTTIRTWINGVPVAHVIDDAAREGFIALQIHSIDSAQEEGRRTFWRNLRLRESKDLSPPDAPIFVRNLLPNHLSDAERQQGWRLLFDGRTTTGWQGRGGTPVPAQRWQVDNGELVLSAGGNGEHIVTQTEYAAFELQLEFKLSFGADSGVGYLVPADAAPFFGLEYQLHDDGNDIEAATPQSLASLFGVLPRAPLLRNLGIAPKVGEWQHARIVVHLDNRVEHWLNGVKALEYVRGSPEFRRAVAASALRDLANIAERSSGRILLQDGGREVRFRSMKIRTL